MGPYIFTIINDYNRLTNSSFVLPGNDTGKTNSTGGDDWHDFDKQMLAVILAILFIAIIFPFIAI